MKFYPEQRPCRDEQGKTKGPKVEAVKRETKTPRVPAFQRKMDETALCSNSHAQSACLHSSQTLPGAVFMFTSG